MSQFPHTPHVSIHGRTPSALTAAPVTPRARRVYIVAIAAIALIGTALLPFARMPMPAAPAFNAVYVTGVIFGDLATAFMLFGQFRASERPSLLALAGAYLFTGAIVLPHLLYFSEFAPGVGWLAGAPQTAAWLWHFWHLGFPIAALGFVAAERWLGHVTIARPRRATMLVVFFVLMLVVAITVLVTTFEHRLPQLHDGRSWNPITFQLGWVMGLAAVAAIVGVLALDRGRTLLHLWLAVALVAFLFDILPNMLALERFAFGWYAGRVSGLIAATFLFAMLIGEINRLYRVHARSLEEVASLNSALEARVEERTEALRESNASLAEAVAERDLLLSEVYHRVNNNLATLTSLLQLERRRHEARDVRDVLDRMARRTRAMGLVHQQLMGARQREGLDLRLFLGGLAANLRESLALDTREIAVEVEVDPLAADIDVAMPLGLVVNELVSNAAEHAFPEDIPGHIRITLRDEGGRWRLEVADDGVGMSGESTGLGDRIVRSLAGQLGGAVATYCSQGVRQVLTMPVPDRAAG